jgi:hypothetical protein
MAALSEVLPSSPSQRVTGGLRRFSLRRFLPPPRVRGLEGIPERYRLQFLLLASERLPGAPAADVAALAGRMADQVRIPAGLVRSLATDTKPLDAWFKGQAERISGLAAQLAGE